jgi:hypothetical protein
LNIVLLAPEAADIDGDSAGTERGGIAVQIFGTMEQANEGYVHFEPS